MSLQTPAVHERSAILGAFVVNVPGLKRRRQDAVLSQRDLAKLSGVSASTIARIEAGFPAHPSTVRKLAAALGCEPRELVEPE